MADGYVFRRPWRRHPRQYRLRGQQYTYAVLRADAGSYAVNGVVAGYTLSTQFGSRKTRAVGSVRGGGIFRKPWFRIIRGANYEINKPAILLQADVGNFVLTGNSASFGTKLLGATQSYVFAGVSAQFNVSFVGAVGSFVETGKPALFSATMPAATGLFALSGNATTIAFPLITSPGAFSVTSSDVGYSTSMEYWTAQSTSAETWSEESGNDESWTEVTGSDETWEISE